MQNLQILLELEINAPEVYMVQSVYCNEFGGNS